MSTPDIDQVREALEWHSSVDGSCPLPLEAHALTELARAFVAGNLIPAEVDYEAAAVEVASPEAPTL